MAGVPTPAVDAVIAIAAIAAARDFRREGLTCERMGIGGMDAAALRELLWTGKASWDHAKLSSGTVPPSNRGPQGGD